MTAPEHDESPPPATTPTVGLVPQPHGGALRPGGRLGNRGGRGRPHTRLIIKASKDLERELARLAQMANAAHDVTCPKCQHVFTPKPTARMDARDRIAYARLLADVKASGKGADEAPVGIVVATGSAADCVASVAEGVEGIEFVDGTQLEPARLTSGAQESGDGAPRTDPVTLRR